MQNTHEELKREMAGVVESFIDAYGFNCLVTLRAIINGKLSKRTISPEQQAKMQASRDAKKEVAKGREANQN